MSLTSEERRHLEVVDGNDLGAQRALRMSLPPDWDVLFRRCPNHGVPTHLSSWQQVYDWVLHNKPDASSTYAADVIFACKAHFTQYICYLRNRDLRAQPYVRATDRWYPDSAAMLSFGQRSQHLPAPSVHGTPHGGWESTVTGGPAHTQTQTDVVVQDDSSRAEDDTQIHSEARDRDSTGSRDAHHERFAHDPFRDTASSSQPTLSIRRRTNAGKAAQTSGARAPESKALVDSDASATHALPGLLSMPLKIEHSSSLNPRGKQISRRRDTELRFDYDEWKIERARDQIMLRGYQQSIDGKPMSKKDLVMAIKAIDSAPQ